MRQFRGLHAAEGIAVGPVRQLLIPKRKIQKWTIEDSGQEIRRFEEAKERASDELEDLMKIASEKLKRSDLTIFQTWLLMVQDFTLTQAVSQMIQEQMVNAEYAVHSVLEEYSQALEGSDEYYMRERTADIHEVEERLMAGLFKEDSRLEMLSQPCIIVSEDLTPEYMIRLDRSKILAFVMAKGSVRSHASIMARIMGVPAVVAAGEELLSLENDTVLAVDGYTGEVTACPDEKLVEKLIEKEEQERQRQEKLRKLVGVPIVTRKGTQVKVYANISSEQELDQVQKNDGEGVGLFRSEWLYLERNTYPSEEMQFIAYSKVLSKMKGRRVVIRTLDVGGDKKADYMQLPEEENPVLGLRGIRVCLEHPEMFLTQLRALYRASVYGNLAIMFPMITSVQEVLKIKQLVGQVQEGLKREKYPFQPVELGIMIETPAAAMISDELAKEVDFFSIGTNDLTQYTLAVDRQNMGMERYYDSTHKAVLRLIKMAAENGRKEGIKVSVCGELGGDLHMTQRFLDMGITVFSVNPPQILPLKEKLLDCE